MGSGDYDTNAYSISAEVGKRIAQRGYWIEPQAQLIYGTVSDASNTTDNRVRVQQDDMTSLIGRVGVRLGKDIKQGNIYARASYLYDFDGETAISLNNDAKIKHDLGGGWWEFGIGTNISLSEVTYLYADIEHATGGEVDIPWQYNIGLRTSF